MAENKSNMKGRVTVYSVPGCPHCTQARAALKKLGLPVCEVDINKHRELQTKVKRLAGCSSVPQIFFNNVYVGNNEDLQKLDPQQLEHLVFLVRQEPVPPDAPPIPDEDVPDPEGVPERAPDVSEAMRNLILKLYSDHLSEDGKTVDYKAVRRSPYYEQYCELAVQLQRVELLSLSREEKLAFFINIYNALVIHGNLRLGFPKTLWQRYRFFNYVSYLIGGEVFTLQDIENGVLRGNRRGMAQFLKPFSKNDPRLRVALHDVEPLIHFALNCGAKGCPPIRTYTPEDINNQLRAAAEAFLENDDSFTIDSMRREVKLSPIFKWYKVDFGGTDEKLLNWVFDHMGPSQKKLSLKALLSAGNVKVSFLPYDWSINSTD
ncbi:hypothetical protein E1301_Tti016139 [Triplophysa tibetana]|uniref:Uncharacterized protein n=1 Tax=Triplophysa tibetana TaxID=1572043 RepID=A0A5A9P2T1_9TELE|nr:hypothetical protein E1301_Tti016139 [Triplophysa tibetana]